MPQTSDKLWQFSPVLLKLHLPNLMLLLFATSFAIERVISLLSLFQKQPGETILPDVWVEKKEFGYLTKVKLSQLWPEKEKEW